MKTMKTTLNCILVIACLVQSVAFAQNAGFKIAGRVTGLKDGTKIYLRNASAERIIDSASVKNGRFAMAGHITESARQVVLFTPKYENYVIFWIENKPITIELKAGDFKSALITGSVTQDENARLTKASLQLKNKQDSLKNILSKVSIQAERDNLTNQLLLLRDEEINFDANYVKQHSNSIISALMLDVYASTWGKEKVLALYGGLSPAMKKTSYGKNVNAFITLNKEVKIGEKFWDFEQLNTKGKKVKLSDIKGEYILLDFWAAWCGPCREENPQLVTLYKQYSGKGFNILGVSADNDKKAWIDAVNSDGLLWENVCDLQGDKNKAALIYGVSAYPTNYLIDKNGIIIEKNVRGKALEDKLKELLP